jgi:hypothetical protein
MMGSRKSDGDQERPTHPTDPAKVEVGHIVCIYGYGKVTAVDPAAESVTVMDPVRGKQLVVDGNDMIQDMASADQFAETIRVSQTEMIDLLISSGGRPFTVDFIKKQGQERRLRGYFLSVDMRRGRSRCIDLDETDEKKIRLVDHRTLELLILGGVRYLAT